MTSMRTALSALIAAALAVGAASAADIAVVLDQDRLIPLPPRVATMIIGNPAIANVAPAAGGAIVTGRSYGETNLILLDRSGAVLSERTIAVRGPDDTVAVHRGAARQSYDCAPICQRRAVLGDEELPAQAATPAATPAAAPSAASGTAAPVPGGATPPAPAKPPPAPAKPAAQPAGAPGRPTAVK